MTSLASIEWSKLKHLDIFLSKLQTCLSLVFVNQVKIDDKVPQPWLWVEKRGTAFMRGVRDLFPN